MNKYVVLLCYYAPTNIMPHYPPVRADGGLVSRASRIFTEKYGWLARLMAGNIGALTKGGSPYSRALITSEDILNTAVVSVYCTVTLRVKSPVIPRLLQGDLIIGYVPYIGAIDI